MITGEAQTGGSLGLTRQTDRQTTDGQNRTDRLSSLMDESQVLGRDPASKARWTALEDDT